MQDKYYLAALSAVDTVGSATLYKLAIALGSGEKIWLATVKELIGVHGVSATAAVNIDHFRHEHPYAPQKIADECNEKNIQVHSALDSPDYPLLLKEIYRMPLVLYVRGTLDPNDFCIGIVGSRKATPYGKTVAETIAKDLAAAGVTVVSGAASGIDTAAHVGALQAGRTVAVLGCGIDIVYPASNRDLLCEIAENGAIVSEYPPGTKPLAALFPQRNRIISGMSRGIVVVEAGEKSGALITANLALDENRDIFSVPGNIFSPLSVGTNGLIADGSAKLITCADDILDEYSYTRQAAKNFAEKREEEVPELTDDKEKKIWQVLSYDTVSSVDEIIMKLDLPADEVTDLSGTLLMMSIKGSVVQDSTTGGYTRAMRRI